MFKVLFELWLLFKREEKLKNKKSFTILMKVQQIVFKELPQTVRLLACIYIMRLLIEPGHRQIRAIYRYLVRKYYQSTILKIKERGLEIPIL